MPDQQCRPLDARTFKDVDPASNAHEIDVNLKRVLNGTKVVIGDMSARNAGHHHQHQLGERAQDPWQSPEELADVVLYCWKLPPHICIRDIVETPKRTTF